ncbi:hypothetical protein Esti_001577 [Eimeria stiedai]
MQKQQLRSSRGPQQHRGPSDRSQGLDAALSPKEDEPHTSSSSGSNSSGKKRSSGGSKPEKQAAAAAAADGGREADDFQLSDGCLDQEEETSDGDTLVQRQQQQQLEMSSNNVLLNTEITWADLHLSRQLLKALDQMGYAHPSHVQAAAIPPALQGRDLLGLGVARSGSGKTAAFLLPLLERLLQSPGMTARGPVGGLRGSKGLILLPTRELALQCYEVLQALCEFAPITSTVAVGGAPLAQQEAALRQQPDVVVGTPGRILDLLLNSASAHLELLEVVVLDEADRLLELGFRDEILQVLKHCHRGRQALLFSATLTPSISSLALLALETPLHIACKPRGVTTSCSSSSKKQQQQHVAENLQQQFVELQREEERMPALIRLVRTSFNKRVIIFFGTKKAAHEAFLVFSLLGLPAAELHGDLTQQMRIEALEKFQQGAVEFLLASELASRGLDVKEVQVVINFAPPKDVDRYIHSVGRTARMGRQGVAATLYNRDSPERLAVKRLLTLLGARGQQEQQKQQQQQKILRRRIDAEQLEAIRQELQGLEGALQKKKQQEKLEREMRLAQIFHLAAAALPAAAAAADEIYSRPQREWFVSRRDKRNIQEASKLDAEAKALVGSSSSKKDAAPAASKKQRQQHEETAESGSSEGDNTSDSEDEDEEGSDQDLPDWVTAEHSGDSEMKGETDEQPVIVRELKVSKEQKAKPQQQQQQQPQRRKEKKQQVMTQKQKERLHEFRTAKAAARSVKRKARPQRMRMDREDDHGDDFGGNGPRRKQRQQRQKRKRREGPSSCSSSSSKGDSRGRELPAGPAAKKQRRPATTPKGRNSFKSTKRYKRR